MKFSLLNKEKRINNQCHTEMTTNVNTTYKDFVLHKYVQKTFKWTDKCLLPRSNQRDPFVFYEQQKFLLNIRTAPYE